MDIFNCTFNTQNHSHHATNTQSLNLLHSALLFQQFPFQYSRRDTNEPNDMDPLFSISNSLELLLGFPYLHYTISFRNFLKKAYVHGMIPSLTVEKEKSARKPLFKV